MMHRMPRPAWAVSAWIAALHWAAGNALEAECHRGNVLGAVCDVGGRVEARA